MKSPLCASEDARSSMQSTPAAVVSLHSHHQSSETEADDVWNVWPYCWAIAGHEVAADRFHSFHKKLNVWRLGRYNRRVLQQHRETLQGWNCEAGAKLVK